MYKSFRHKTSLDDFPVEILPVVASYLDLKDIVSLQQTNKKLRKSINVPVVWRALAKAYAARHFNIYRPQLGGFDGPTEDGLPKWIQKRLKFDKFWKEPTPHPASRSLPEPSSGYPMLNLVLGGRWLLAGCERGFVWYCDLDLKELQWKALIEPSKAIKGSDHDVYELATYADSDVLDLHFTLAIRTKDKRDISAEWLHVWQVKIKDGESLITEWLASVPTSYNEGYASALAIGRRVVARIRDNPEVEGFVVIELYWWKQCSATRIVRSRFLAPLGSNYLFQNHIYLIGDDRVLSADASGGFNLYVIPEPEHIIIEQNLDPPRDVPCPKPSWSYTISNRETLTYSPLYHDDATYRITTRTNEGTFGLSIPTTKGRDPSVIRLSTFFDPRTICVLGLYKAFAVYNEANGVKIGYDWESGDWRNATTASTKGEFTRPSNRCFIQTLFDEESGRIVYDRNNEIVVVNFLDTEF